MQPRHARQAACATRPAAAASCATKCRSATPPAASQQRPLQTDGARPLAPPPPPPPQVAETFAMAAEEGGPPLSEVARLDTCVTVVDAANLMANL